MVESWGQSSFKVLSAHKITHYSGKVRIDTKNVVTAFIHVVEFTFGRCLLCSMQSANSSYEAPLQ